MGTVRGEWEGQGKVYPNTRDTGLSNVPGNGPVARRKGERS